MYPSGAVVPAAAAVKENAYEVEVILEKVRPVGWLVGSLARVTVLTVKVVELVPVKPPTVTLIVPVVAPAGTMAVMLVAVGVPVMLVTVVPLNFTVLLPAVVLKFVPVIVTDVPTGPLFGLKLVIVGIEAVVTVKLPVLVPV